MCLWVEGRAGERGEGWGYRASEGKREEGGKVGRE